MWDSWTPLGLADGKPSPPLGLMGHRTRGGNDFSPPSESWSHSRGSTWQEVWPRVVECSHCQTSAGRDGRAESELTLLPAPSLMGSMLEARRQGSGAGAAHTDRSGFWSTKQGWKQAECICGQRGTIEHTRHCCCLTSGEGGWDKGRGAGWAEAGRGNSLAVQQFGLRTFPVKGAGFDPWLGN